MSPRTPKQFEEMREEKKALIMDTALEHFASYGFHATTINHIARHAGISKGLMYNYFKSKEALLSEIISRSLNDLYSHFDQNRDGFLTEEEFEIFIIKLASIIDEKRSIMRLFFQMMMQKEVIEKVFVKKQDTGKLTDFAIAIGDVEYIPGIVKMFTDYFRRKAGRMDPGYDPDLEMNMFLMTIKGFVLTYVFTESDNDLYFNRSLNRIIELYK